jgi:hypothetical protein
MSEKERRRCKNTGSHITEHSFCPFLIAAYLPLLSLSLSLFYLGGAKRV